MKQKKLHNQAFKFCNQMFTFYLLNNAVNGNTQELLHTIMYTINIWEKIELSVCFRIDNMKSPAFFTYSVLLLLLLLYTHYLCVYKSKMYYANYFHLQIFCVISQKMKNQEQAKTTHGWKVVHVTLLLEHADNDDDEYFGTQCTEAAEVTITHIRNL